MIRPAGTLPAATVYLSTKAAASLASALVFTVSGIYLVTVVALNPLQLVLVGTALEAAVFLFEVPTGVVADVYSRRLSIIIGMFLMGAGFVLWGAVPNFAVVLASQVIWGIGHTFTSGADTAWISDEVGEDRVNPLYLRAAQARQVGSLCGIAIGAALGTIRLNLPMIIGGCAFAGIGVFMLLFMPETRFARASADHRTTWHNFGRIFSGGVRLVRARPILLMLLVVGALYGMASESFDRLWEVGGPCPPSSRGAPVHRLAQSGAYARSARDGALHGRAGRCVRSDRRRPAPRGRSHGVLCARGVGGRRSPSLTGPGAVCARNQARRRRRGPGGQANLTPPNLTGDTRRGGRRPCSSP